MTEPRPSPARPPLTLSLLGRMLLEALHEWNEDKAPRLGAALAFYSILSIGPLLLIVTGIAGIAFGREAVNGYMMAELSALIGDQGASAVQTMLSGAFNPRQGLVATVIGFITLIISATGFFAQLQEAMNDIWNVEPPRLHWKVFIQKRLLSFALVVGIGFLLLISLVVSAGLAAFSAFISPYIPAPVMGLINLILSFGVVTFLFAMTFKILPDARIEWSDVWVGAAITAILFSFGKQLIGLYLGQSAMSSAYGAAGSLIVLLVWIYYSTQIFFFGAEFTQVYSRHLGKTIQPRRKRKATPEL
ncbi:YihY/virulence factor BrkB family protein [Asticcacaulis sp. DW145]|uniref:YihY/virulence factor BrkB family protein n=1 Tax=Asticcacaulis currens TaxID=2984210 RepID=A0ABT5IFP2_9CAUL|nr:YihY/virulence factor BrkB family protein [Asticcacaulis currens]MDC7695016.1 YihY/virulence factor BrkB family protein [Asticcacaulis currens]BEV12257.1 YihY/virulence factor BrkB family protein [Asticcacaulis sp. DW145]